jgi:NADPH:quinone reductase-like Zn-dependent oxidoreductase
MATTSASSSSTPTESRTTPNAGIVSRPVNGGAKNAPAEPPITSSPNTQEDFVDGARRYDLILDLAGRRSLSELRRALTPRGTLVLVGGEGSGRWTGGFERQLRAILLSPLVRQTLRSLFSTERQEDLLVPTELIEAGSVTPVINQTYPLNEVANALRDADEGHGRGKTVITV